MQLNSLLVAVICVVFLGFTGCSGGGALNGNQDLYLKVVDGVNKGTIKTDAEKGIVIPDGSVRQPFSAQLPPNLRDASMNGEIYVLRPNAGHQVVIFKTWIGKGFNMEGFLYTSRRFTNSEIRKDYYGNSVFAVGPSEITLEKELDPNWYKVSRHLD
jgi:hypothetical protein